MRNKLCKTGHSYIFQEERPEHLNSKWLHDISIALKNSSKNKVNADYAYGLMRKYLAHYFVQILDILHEEEEGAEFAYLTYYSNLLPKDHDEIKPDQATILEFRSIPLTPFGRENREEIEFILNPDRKKLMLDYLEKSKKSGVSILKDAPKYDNIKELDKYRINEPDPDIQTMHTFLAIVQNKPCAPVFISEAIGLDHHLVEKNFSGIVREILFPNSSSKESQLSILLKMRAKLMADCKENPDSCLIFSKEESEKFIGDIEAIAAQYGKEKFSTTYSKIETLVENTMFEFSASPEEVGVPGLSVKTLKKCAQAVLWGFLSKTHQDEIYNNHICLKEFWKKATDSIKSGQADILIQDNYLLEEHWFSVIPALPFFLLALFSHGTYIDFIDFILPIFLLDIGELHVDSVDRCHSPEDIITEIVACFKKFYPLKQKSNETSMAAIIRMLVYENAFGQLVRVRKTGVLKKRSQFKEACCASMSRIECLLRSAIIPLRTIEDTVRMEIEEYERGEILRRAYQGLIHDLRNDLLVLRGLADILVPGDDKIPRGTISIRDFFRDDVPPEILCSIPDSEISNLSMFWRQLVKRPRVLTNSQGFSRILVDTIALFEHISDEIEVFMSYHVEGVAGEPPDDGFLKDLRGEDIIKAIDRAMSLITGGAWVKSQFSIKVKNDQIFQGQCLSFIVAAVKMVLSNAAKYSDSIVDVSGELSRTDNGGLRISMENGVNLTKLETARGTKTRRQVIVEIGEWLYGERFSRSYTPFWQISENKKYSIELIMGPPIGEL